MGGMPIYSAKRWLKFTSYFCLYFEVYFIILFCSYYCLTPPTLPIEGWGAWAFSLLFSCINCAWKKVWRMWAAWLYSAAGGFSVCFPDFLLDFDITGRGCVCVYMWGFIFVSIVYFSFTGSECSGLSNYLPFLLVWFVYWLIVSRIVLICFYMRI